MKLFEGYFDSVDKGDIVRDVEDSNIKNDESIQYNHYIDISYQASSMSIEKKSVGFDRLIKYIIKSYFDKCDFINNYKVVYIEPNNLMYDTFKNALESPEHSRYNTFIRILFSTYDDLSYRAIMNILYIFLSLNKKINKVLPNIIYNEGFTLDGNANFLYDDSIYRVFRDKIYRDKKLYKVIKHFILSINKKRAIAKQLDGLFDEYDNYLGLHIRDYDFKSMFCEDEDMKKCIIHTVNGLLYIDIPENETVHMHSNRASMWGKIRVKGTLIFHKHLVGGNPYHNNDYSEALYLDDSFLHNHIIYDFTFDDAPYFSNISSKMDMLNRKIITVDIVADDIYIDGEDELKDVVKLSNIDNVTMLNYIIKEDE